MNIQGIGEVYEGNQKRAKVRYDLSMEQEYQKTVAFDSSQVLPGLESGSGSIYVLDGKITLEDMGKIITLYMDDGKTENFLITDLDIATGRFVVNKPG